MAINFLLKRSNVASKRPTAAQLDIGELSLNYDANTAGVFFEDSAGNIRKVGPAEVSATAPNATPAGSSGNSLGELWYDTGTSNLKIWTGSSFVESRASVATLTTTRTLWGQNFNGSANVTGSLTSVGDITATAAINITSATTNAITVDSGTTGNVNLGTGANAKAIAIGNSGVASTIALNNSTTITGNLTVDTSTLFVDATNNRVGVNTTSPAFSFQVGTTGAGGVAINESLSAIFGTFGAGGNLTLRAQTTATAGGGQVYLGGSTRGDADKNLVRFDTNGVVRGCFAEDGVFHVGGRHISATPAAGIISGVGGSGTDIAGASLTIRGGLGTGTGVGGGIIFSTAAAGTTGSTLNSATQRMRINSSGNLLPEADNTYALGSSALRWSGVSSAAFNKVTITEPATSATLTIANTKTLTVSNTLTFTGTDSSSVAFGTGGTVAYTGGTLAQFAATTSAQLAGVISDETGSGALVFGTSPAITTSLTTPSTSFDLINTTATTVNFAGAATTLAIGNASGTTTISGQMVINTNTAGNALKITQTGAGDCLLVEDASSDTTPFVIKSDGKVGVGALPSKLLHLANTGDGAQLLVEDTGGTGGIIQIANSFTGKTSTDGLLIGYDSSNDVIINNQENTQLKINTNGTTRITIPADGNRVTCTGNVVAPGAVIQVVHSEFTTGSTVATGGVATAITNFTATITPKSSSSKILAIVHFSGVLDCDGYLLLYRSIGGGADTLAKTQLLGTDRSSGLTTPSVNYYDVATYAASYLDSPATTSSIVYKIYALCAGCGRNAYVNTTPTGGSNGFSGITLMEIGG